MTTTATKTDSATISEPKYPTCEYCGHSGDDVHNAYQCLHSKGKIVICDSLSECKKRIEDKFKREYSDWAKEARNYGARI